MFASRRAVSVDSPSPLDSSIVGGSPAGESPVHGTVTDRRSGSLSALVGGWPDDRRAARKIRVLREGELENHLLFGFRNLFGVARLAGIGEPIATYTVHLGQRNDIRRSRRTGGGEYEFLDLSTGTYLVWVRAPGFVRMNHGNVEIVAGSEARLDFGGVGRAQSASTLVEGGNRLRLRLE